MTIPLDNLYHYIDGLFSEPVCMYLFYPHGSRNILDLTGVKSFNQLGHDLDSMVFPQIICIDQETLNYNLYQHFSQEEIDFIYNIHRKTNVNENLRFAVAYNIHDDPILLHSEKNSSDLDRYKKEGFVDVYYWCHALIARDWFRFAEHDVRLNEKSNKINDFLIYCRDWSGSREYRVKFQELLNKNNLTTSSITGIKKINGCGFNIDNFNFVNQQFVPNNTDFFLELDNNNTEPTASADYCAEDFLKTNISVVLETVFDGSKIHLTEKTLRPLACGHPFILASGPGSLEYIRSYGFKTFSPWIDEDYDLEQNSAIRLEKIINSMKKFNELSVAEKTEVCKRLGEIADYNKKWFFSKEFIDLVTTELKSNIDQAMLQVKKTRSVRFRKFKNNDIDKTLIKEKRKLLADYLRKLKNLNSKNKN
jgi:hypothetical protein